MLNVYYGNDNLYGYLVCEGNITGQKIKCNVYKANCLFAWVAREYSEEKDKDGKFLINSYLWGWFNDTKHLNNYLRSGFGDSFIEVIINKKAPQNVIKALEKIATYCQLPLSYKDDLNEKIYGGND